MNTLLGILAATITASPLTWFADLALKSLLVLAVAGMASLALRHASAAVRHLVWCLGMASVLLLPLLTLALPSWRVGIPASWATVVATEDVNGSPNEIADRTTHRASALGRAEADSWSVSAPATMATPGSKESPSHIVRPEAGVATSEAILERSGQAWLMLGWGLGGLAVLAPLLVGVGALARMARQARQIKEPAWAELLGELTATLRLGRPVRLLESPATTIPMTWGNGRPVVLLPAGADAWPEERRRVVLLHELAHVKRWDCLTQMLARLACALFWFNPLAWVAVWRMRVERERACDDLVLLAGAKPSDYADQLLDIATSFRGRRFTSALSIAMARPSTLEGRLLAILDRARNRRAVTRWMVLMGLMALGCLVVPVAMLRAGVGSAPSAEEKSAITSPILTQSVNLPHPSGIGQKDGKTLDPKDVRTVEITAKGEYLYDRISLPLDQIEAMLVKTLRTNFNLVVAIRVDENSPYKSVAEILDRCERHGIARISLRTESASMNASDWYKLPPQVVRFLVEKEKQAEALAKAEGQTLPAQFEAYFTAAKLGNWDTFTNLYAELRRQPPEYKDTNIAFNNIAYRTLPESFGVFEQFVVGEPKYAEAFARDIIDSIPAGSIYFGGTDPGRFLITAYSKSHAAGDPFFTLTQNRMADGSYLAYLRYIYGQRLRMPSAADGKQCFDNYYQDAVRRVQEGRLEPGEDVKVSPDGRVEVRGQVAVMQINGSLARLIFDANPEREFYVEESYPLRWMYPHLTPHRLILKLNRQPVGELTEEIVKADREYWSRYLVPLLGDWLTPGTPINAVCEFAEKVHGRKDLTGFRGDPKFVNNEYPGKTFGKLRGAIAGLYAWRAQNTKDPREHQRLTAAADFAFRQAFAMCPYSSETLLRYVNLLSNGGRWSDAIALAEVVKKLTPNDQQVNTLLDQLYQLRDKQKGEAGAKTAEPSGRSAGHLAAAVNQAPRYQEKNLNDWVSDLESPDNGVVYAARQALADMGTNAAPVIPRLAQMLMLNSGHYCNSAAITLVMIGTNSLPVLLEALTNGNRIVRFERRHPGGMVDISPAFQRWAMA